MIVETVCLSIYGKNVCKSYRQCVDPLFFGVRPHSMGETRFFFFVLLENHLKKKRFGAATYFCFYFKRENKIRKKNPKCDS